jgi:cullin-associated NEDD8-dissociated protein 1
LELAKVSKALMSRILVAASLAASMSDDLLARATITVVQILKNKEVRPEMTRTNIQMIGAFW